MPLGRIVAVLLPTLVLTGLVGLPADADTSTDVSLSASSGYAGKPTRLSITLTDGGAPVVGDVVVERRRDGTWRPVASVTTAADGAAEIEEVLAKQADDNVFRARFAGDGAHAPASSGRVRAELVKRRSKLTVGGPEEVLDGRRTALRVRWRTGNGEPVAGTVHLYQRHGDRWRPAGRLRTGADGRATRQVRPRVDTRWQARVRPRDWLQGDRSRVHAIDNLPPGRPVSLPRGAPRPRIQLPPQRRATGRGAEPVVTRIPDRVWREMTGRSWHRGCPVGRAGLRLVRVNYWGYDGYRYRGELVAAASVAGRMAAALTDMYAGRFPIRSMYRVDRFGWSRRLHGANDYRSMAAGNTSAFNCRQVVNRPGVRSPHSYGRSLDVNTWENPYRSPTGLVPNVWWQRHSHPLVAWRSRAHPVVRIMARHGLRWTYGLGDTQHFDAGGGHARLQARPGCRHVVCD